MNYGGGGGGGANANDAGSVGVGGAGGGGSGGNANHGSTAGQPNTGGGGGGSASYNGSSGDNGAAGGSGIVIVSAPQNQLFASGGSHSIVNGNDIWTFPSNSAWTLSSIASLSNPSLIADEQYLYDNLPFGQVASGNVTQQNDWVSGSTYASSTKSYNTYGLVASSTDARSNTTTYQYDPFNLYVATSTNPLSQQTQYTYEYSNGKVEKTTDPNGHLTNNIYDGVGRLIETDQSDTATPSTLDTAVRYQYTDNTTTPSIVHRANYLTATTTVNTYDFYDGLNRPIQERKIIADSGYICCE